MREKREVKRVWSRERGILSHPKIFIQPYWSESTKFSELFIILETNSGNVFNRKLPDVPKIVVDQETLLDSNLDCLNLKFLNSTHIMLYN